MDDVVTVSRDLAGVKHDYISFLRVGHHNTPISRLWAFGFQKVSGEKQSGQDGGMGSLNRFTSV
jgi:hypothetical protein